MTRPVDQKIKAARTKGKPPDPLRVSPGLSDDVIEVARDFVHALLAIGTVAHR